MSNYLDFSGEAGIYDQLTQFNKEQKEEYKAREDSSMGELGLTVPLIGNIVNRGKEFVTKGQDVITKGKAVISKLDEGATKVQKSVEDAGTKLEGLVGESKDLVTGSIQKAEGLAAKTEDLATGTLNKVKLLGENTVSKAKGFVSDIQTTGENLKGSSLDSIQMAKSGLTKRGIGLQNELADRSDVGQSLEDLKSGVSSVIRRGTSSVADDISIAKANYSSVGRKTASSIFNKQFEQDPESSLVDSGMNESRGALFKLQSAFRSGSKPLQIPEGLGNSASDTLNASKGAMADAVKGITGRATSEVKGAVSGIQSTGEQIAGQAKEGVTHVVGLAQEGVSDISKQGAEIASQAAEKATGLIGEGGEAVMGAVGKAASIAGEATEAAVGVGEAVGAVVAEAVPVVGELVGAGLGLASLFTNIENKPKVYGVAAPKFTPGL
jgi:hypothetical protein